MRNERTRWQPREVVRFIRNFDSGAGTVEVKTDAGRAYLKGMGNHSGPHVLACEWVGTQLAEWLGLEVFDYALVTVTDADELPLYRGGFIEPGLAFVTRGERGQSWGGKPPQLKRVANRDDITRLVVLDTWTRNCDRFSSDGQRVNRDNVFLSEEAPAGKFVLKAMDHTHCFTCGRDLTARMAQIAVVKDDGIYGRFPEFEPFLDRTVFRKARGKLKSLQRAFVSKVVETIPDEWDVSSTARTALIDFIVGRAAYLVDKMERRLWPQGELNFGEEE
jgi:hypothetical protein